MIYCLNGLGRCFIDNEAPSGLRPFYSILYIRRKRWSRWRTRTVSDRKDDLAAINGHGSQCNKHNSPVSSIWVLLNSRQGNDIKRLSK
jgi:hypothetical protein